MRVRTTKTKSKATAVQIVRYDQGKTIILKHVGSASDPAGIAHLKETARDWIIEFTHQQTFLEKESTLDPLLSEYQYLGVRYNFLYEVLNQIL